MITRAMLLCFAASLALVGEAAAQGTCPPEGGERAAFLLTGFTPTSFNADHVAKAGLPDFAPEEARVLRDDSDAEVCAALMEWAKTLPRGASPNRRWTFYEVRDRYIVVSWLVHRGAIQPRGSVYLAILNPDVDLIWITSP